MRGETYHILGSGNPFDPKNHILRARLEAVMELATSADTICVYGRKQAGMAQSESDLMKGYLADHADHLFVSVRPQPKSTSETLQYVAADVCNTVSPTDDDPAPALHHIVITNRPYMARTRYLLRKQWQRKFSNIPWKDAKKYVTFVSVGDTFAPRWKRDGLRAIPWWLWNVAAREVAAWVKALRDPYDQRLNQNRESADIFKG